VAFTAIEKIPNKGGETLAIAIKMGKRTTPIEERSSVTVQQRICEMGKEWEIGCRGLHKEGKGFDQN